MIGILMATQMEAEPFLEKMRETEKGEEDADHVTRFVRGEFEIAVALVGMGKSLAGKAVERFVARYQPDRIINAGIAGALNDNLKIGTVYRVSSTVNWPEASHRRLHCAATGFEKLQSASLVTSDRPVFDDTLRRTLQPFGDMVDMEGAVIADICSSLNVECIALKCISDFASNGDREQLRKNLDTAARSLGTLLWKNVGVIHTR